MFNVVTDLCEDFLNKKHHVYADNTFTSFQLAKHLLEQETYLNGMLRANASTSARPSYGPEPWLEGM